MVAASPLRGGGALSGRELASGRSRSRYPAPQRRHTPRCRSRGPRRVASRRRCPARPQSGHRPRRGTGLALGGEAPGPQGRLVSACGAARSVARGSGPGPVEPRGTLARSRDHQRRGNRAGRTMDPPAAGRHRPSRPSGAAQRVLRGVRPHRGGPRGAVADPPRCDPRDGAAGRHGQRRSRRRDRGLEDTHRRAAAALERALARRRAFSVRPVAGRGRGLGRVAGREAQEAGGSLLVLAEPGLGERHRRCGHRCDGLRRKGAASGAWGGEGGAGPRCWRWPTGRS